MLHAWWWWGTRFLHSTCMISWYRIIFFILDNISAFLKAVSYYITFECMFGLIYEKLQDCQSCSRERGRRMAASVNLDFTIGDTLQWKCVAIHRYFWEACSIGQEIQCVQQWTQTNKVAIWQSIAHLDTYIDPCGQQLARTIDAFFLFRSPHWLS